MKKLYSSIVLLFVTLTITNAQTSESPWAVNIGANLVSIQDDSVDSKTGIGVPILSLSRYIAAGFSIGAQYSINSVDVNSIDLNYTSIEAILKYNISEGKVYPYLFTGYGLTNFAKNTESGALFPSTVSGRTYLGGVGLNFQISDHWNINASSAYKSSSERGSYNHLQHVVGFSYVFGAQDTDKDGVSDKKDVCPEIPGLKEFDGCPDTDGDGIPDNKDACPEEAGSAELNGCPDADGDGIADKDDACPNAAGSEAMNGCPDSDGDGVADNIDKCPNEAGDPANNGCPWADRDGDGVADKDDTCPDEKGDAANNGCPAVPEKLVAFLQGENSILLFSADSADITEISEAKLKELNDLLNSYPNAAVIIEGHASSDGSMEHNQKLSEKRADSVKAALIAKGIDAARLDTAAYGETKPVEDNNTSKGRAANRRVKFERRVEIRVAE